MKKQILLTGLTVALITGITACGTKTTNTSTGASTTTAITTTANTTSLPSTTTPVTTTAVTTTPPSTTTAIPTTKASNEEYLNYTNGIIEYSIPESWREKVEREDLIYYYPGEGLLMVDYEETDQSITNDDFREVYNENVADGFDSYVFMTEQQITVAGKEAYRHNMIFETGGKKFAGSLVTLDYNNGITSLFMTLQQIGSEKEYVNEFQNILDSVKLVEDLSSDAELGKPIMFEDFEVTLKSVKRATTYDKKDAIRILYDFKNLKDETQMPMSAVGITVYQNGVELSTLAVFMDGNDNGLKKIKTGAIINDVYSNHLADPDDGELTIEVKPLFSFDDSEIVELVVNYPSK